MEISWCRGFARCGVLNRKRVSGMGSNTVGGADKPGKGGIHRTHMPNPNYIPRPEPHSLVNVDLH